MYDGTTYHGRSQLKPAPFNSWIVGGYIFLAGLSGGAQIVSTAADLLRGGDERRLVRRGRLMTMLAPTLGAALLVWDLHTPKRFYNMLRVAKATSPMSVGTWLLAGFTACAAATLGADLATGARRPRGWLRALARIAQVPAALFGMGIGSYTATLMAATSTPLWAAAPRGLPVRYAGSAIASAAAALSFGARRRQTRRALDNVALAALATELAASLCNHRRYEATGVAPVMRSGWGRVEILGVGVLGTALPLGLLAAARLRGGHSRLAPLLTLAGGALMRVSMLELGRISAEDPRISLRFSQPDNL